MANLFDTVQKIAFGIVSNTFGYTAKWTPSTGGNENTAIVLYKDATEAHGLSDVDYNIERFLMEYQYGDFKGLKQAVANGETERVSIELSDGLLKPFIVRRIETKYDGKTIVAFLNPAQ
jgi:hypothetical protein